MTTVSNKNAPTSASPDPDLGLAYLLDYERGSNGQRFDGVQASGVLVSPDELLTAAHVVYGTDGLRDSGQVFTGYESGSSTGQAAITSVHTIAQADYTTDAGTASDFALIHLATAIAGGTVFDLGASGGPGTYEVSGYPSGTAGALDTKTETLTVDQPYSNFVGTPENEGSGNAHGSSGGPIWQEVGGVPTVFGVISSESSDGSTGYFKRLTSSDVAQIRSWISEDDSAPSPAPPAITGTAGGQQTAAEAPLSPFSSAAVTDANANATEVLSIALGGGGGLLTGQGLQSLADGTYQLQGTAAGVTAMLRALRFTPAAGAPGVPTTTRFTLGDASSAGTSTADGATTVTDTAAPVPPASAPVPSQPVPSQTVPMANAQVSPVDPSPGTGGVASTAARVITPGTAFQDMVAQKGRLSQGALLGSAESEAMAALARAVRRGATTLTDALEASIARTSAAPHAALDGAFLLGVEYGGIGGLRSTLRADLGGSYPGVIVDRATCAAALTGDAMGLALKHKGLYS